MLDKYKKIQEYLNNRKDEGFSLLELVVALGILLVLTVGGLLAYNTITNNARQAAVNRSASELHTYMMSKYSGSNGEYAQAKVKEDLEDWVSSHDNYKDTATVQDVSADPKQIKYLITDNVTKPTYLIYVLSGDYSENLNDQIVDVNGVYIRVVDGYGKQVIGSDGNWAEGIFTAERG